MAIQFRCLNGHKLRVDEEHAGKKGSCPKCNAIVRIPQPARQGISDSSILALLGEPRLLRPMATRVTPAARPTSRTCPKCSAEISQSRRVCPSCNVYLPTP